MALIKSPTPIFKMVPKRHDDFRGMHNAIIEIQDYLTKQAFDFDAPGVPTGFRYTLVSSGVQLNWAAVAKAATYYVLRGLTNIPERAQVRQILPGQQNISFLDVGGQNTGETIYYWIQAYNAANVPGPLSAMLTVVDPGI